jgi:hypothetical protein
VAPQFSATGSNAERLLKALSKIFASIIAITPKVPPIATGAQGCESGWWRKAEVGANGYHQVNSNYRLALIFASIKALMTGSR